MLAFTPLPSPQVTVDDTRIRRIKNLSLQLKNQGPEESEAICQRQNQLNNRPVLEGEGSGGGRGVEYRLRLQGSPPSFGQVEDFPWQPAPV